MYIYIEFGDTSMISMNR